MPVAWRVAWLCGFLCLPAVAWAERQSATLSDEDILSTIKVSGYLQQDIALYDNPRSLATTQDGEDNYRVYPRRLRLNVIGRHTEAYFFKLGIDFAEQELLQDAYIDLQTDPWLVFRLGRFRHPFGNEALTPARFREFMEQAAINMASSQSRDQGLLMWGGSAQAGFQYQLGLLTGTEAHRESGVQVHDAIGRAVLRLSEAHEHRSVRAWLGVSYAHGRLLAGDEPVVRVETESFSEKPVFSSYMTLNTAYTRVREGADLTLVSGALMLRYETQRIEYIVNAPATVRGYQVSLSWFFTEELRSLRFGLNERQMIFSQLGEGDNRWGALALTLRYSEYNVDYAFFQDDYFYTGWRGADKQSNAHRGESHTLGLNWYLDPMVRVSANWVRSYAVGLPGTEFAGRANIENAVLTRFQMEF